MRALGAGGGSRPTLRRQNSTRANPSICRKQKHKQTNKKPTTTTTKRKIEMEVQVWDALSLPRLEWHRLGGGDLGRKIRQAPRLLALHLQGGRIAPSSASASTAHPARLPAGVSAPLRTSYSVRCEPEELGARHRVQSVASPLPRPGSLGPHPLRLQAPPRFHSIDFLLHVNTYYR